MTTTERAFWVEQPGVGVVRSEVMREPGPDEVRVRTRWSAVSRGTESVVFSGRVPPSEHERMRAPFQEGEFPGPVKYGYLAVGVVEAGPPRLHGRAVFALSPHQTAAILPADAVLPVPDGVPLRRAVLAGIVETAVNALWDQPVLVGDRVAVVGGGAVGCCVVRLAARQPGTTVTLVDIDPSRAETARALGADFALPGSAPAEQDVVFHASATSDGLARALELLRTDGTLVELSWYGSDPVALPLGGVFHSRRLTIRASQVGLVAPARRDARSTRRRLALALELLADPAFDALLSDPTPFEDLPLLMASIAGGDRLGLCRLIDYGGSE